VRNYVDEILQRLTRIEAKQDLQSKTCDSHSKRIKACEQFLCGNGKIGLLEEVRNLKTKWTMATILVSTFVSGFVIALSKFIAEVILKR
jgi:hypothetical protein